MESFILHYLTWWHPLGYVIVFVGMILEGDIILFTASFLTHQGFFDLGNMIFTVLAGVIIGDLLWYWLGIWINNKTFFLGRWIRRLTKKIDSHLSERPFYAIFLYKFVYGLNHAVLLKLGMNGVPFTKFIKIDLAAIMLWTIIVGGLGYLSGASFLLLKHYFRFAEFALLAVLAFFFILGYFLERFFAKKI